MRQSDRTIKFLAHSLERARRGVFTLRRELTEAMRVNLELTEQAKVYEAEAVRMNKILEATCRPRF